MIGPITGLILAGGRSSRMGGTDKGLMTLGDKSMIEQVIERVRPQVQTLLISANRNLQRYRDLGFEVLEDQSADFQGPLAGMLRGLDRIDRGCLLTVPCDGPLIPADLAARLDEALQRPGAVIATVSDGERRHPTYALIRHDQADDLRRFLASGERKLGKWFAACGALEVDFSDRKEAFYNVNTVSDLQRVQALVGTVRARDQQPRGSSS
jgi:molybdopterin-guanine dinucleotide biosynthesis protein A